MEEPESVVALVVAGFGETMAFSSADSLSAKDARLVLVVSFVEPLLAEVFVSCGVAMDAMLGILENSKASKANAVAPKCKMKRLRALMMLSGRRPKYACALAAQ